MSEAENDLLTYFYPLSLVKGKPTTIFASIYVESFGNIEEANMVCMLDCISLLKYKYGNTPPPPHEWINEPEHTSRKIRGKFCHLIATNR